MTIAGTSRKTRLSAALVLIVLAPRGSFALSAGFRYREV